MADHLCILLIEDDYSVRDTLAKALVEAGHTVKQAATLNGAKRELRLAKENNELFDAILSDYHLQLDGIKTRGDETYAMIRELAGPEVPLLCASSDIPMWERIKEIHEDERMFTRKKVRDFERDSRLSYWDKQWVKETLATVKDLPPLPKKLPRILLASKDASFIDETKIALKNAGYEIALCDSVLTAADHLLSRGGKKSQVVAIISDFELASGSSKDLFIVANMKKNVHPFIATSEDLEQWAPTQKVAEDLGLTLHLVARAPALFLTKLKELGL